MTAPAPRQSNWPEHSLFAATAALIGGAYALCFLALAWVLS